MNRIHRTLTGTGVILAGLAVVGCGSASAVPASTLASVSSPSGDGLTGMGATLAQFTAAHSVDVCNPADSSGSAPNICFGPAVNAGDTNGNASWQFSPVHIEAGLVDSYDQNFALNTPLSVAQAQIMQWMPKDAVMGPLTVDHNGGSCGVLTITSPTLAKLFSDPKIGDPTGVVGVVLLYINDNLDKVYDPANIGSASMSPTPGDPAAAC